MNGASTSQPNRIIVSPLQFVRFSEALTPATAAGEVVNAWFPEDDCASLDVTVHARISE